MSADILRNDIGKKILISAYDYDVLEVRIEDVSLLGRYVKVSYYDINKNNYVDKWVLNADIQILDYVFQKQEEE